jgi:hypothetical protein
MEIITKTRSLVGDPEVITKLVADPEAKPFSLVGDSGAKTFPLGDSGAKPFSLSLRERAGVRGGVHPF